MNTLCFTLSLSNIFLFLLLSCFCFTAIFILGIILDNIGVPPFPVAVIKFGLCFIPFVFFVGLGTTGLEKANKKCTEKMGAITCEKFLPCCAIKETK
ncbi:hypothetical protein [Helicobacter equorum]|uniref:Uncharacterized protein n=1 Tax=Helicobacter equorum TaxID=361872 RepID=A0A3D8IMF9_9HELI|nr:hypothetical protein [Helicobacter equorum]RDU66467.1 hypothetical protein CQA54_07135 [Helicobacter equorum]